MKKVMSTILSIAIMMSMCVPTYAADVSATGVDLSKVQKQVVALAYTDLEQADAEMKEMIIEARNEIIFSNDWVVDDVNGYVLDRDGNIIEEVPHFSELFPADWDVPNMIDSKGEATSNAMMSEYPDGGIMWYNNWATLSEPSEFSDSPAFCSASIDTSGLGYHVVSLVTYGEISGVFNATFNAGYANAKTGASLGFKEHITNGTSFSITNLPSKIEVAVRASTYNTPGDWWMTVYSQTVDDF